MNIHIGEMIRAELCRQERTVAWFARKICCTRPHAYKIFQRRNIDIELLERASRTLSRNFFKDLAAIYESEECNIIGNTNVANPDKL